MSFHKITARMIDIRVEIETSGKPYSVFRHDDREGNGICPMDYFAGSLGSWIVLTVAAVAAEKKICLESLQMHLQLRSYDGDSGNKGFSIFYQTEEFDIPGVTVDDWSQAFKV